MTEPALHQEAEGVSARAIWLAAAGVVAIGAALVAIAWLLVAPPPAAERPVAAASPLEHGLIDTAAGGEQIRAAGEQRLERYEWVDRGAGVVRIPIDRAIDAVVADPRLIATPSAAFTRAQAPRSRRDPRSRRPPPASRCRRRAGRSPPRSHRTPASRPRRWRDDRGHGVALAALGALALAGPVAASPSRSAAPPGSPPSTAPSPLAEPGSPAWAETADVVEHLGAKLPPELRFVDAGGRRVTLGSLFDGRRPVLLVLAYYECPQLCSLVLDAAIQAIRQLEPDGFALGQQYRAVTISFDATERIDQAARKQAGVLGKLGVRINDDGSAAWPFLVGDDAAVRALTDAARLPLPARPADRRDRPPRGRLRADARRHDLALPLRHRRTRRAISGWRCSRPPTARPDRIGDRVAARAASATTRRAGATGCSWRGSWSSAAW